MPEQDLVSKFKSLKDQLEKLRLEQARLEESSKFHALRVAEIFRKNGVDSIEELEKKHAEAEAALKAAMVRWQELLDQVSEQLINPNRRP